MTMHEDMELRSRLPQAPEYWDDLARRVVAHGYPMLRQYQRREQAWWSPIARFSPALAAAALILAVGYFLAGPAPVSGSPLSLLEEAVIPEDPMVRSMLTTAAGAPAIELLLPLTPSEREGP